MWGAGQPWGVPQEHSALAPNSSAGRQRGHPVAPKSPRPPSGPADLRGAVGCRRTPLYLVSTRWLFLPRPRTKGGGGGGAQAAAGGSVRFPGQWGALHGPGRCPRPRALSPARTHSRAGLGRPRGFPASAARTAHGLGGGRNPPNRRGGGRGARPGRVGGAPRRARRRRRGGRPVPARRKGVPGGETERGRHSSSCF